MGDIAMGRALRIACITLLSLAFLGALGYEWLLGEVDASAKTEASAETHWSVKLSRLRAVARGPIHQRPVRVNSELVATSTFPRGAVVSGTGFGPHPMIRQAWQVVYEGGGFGVIDSVMDRSLHEELSRGEATFDDVAYARLAKGLVQAEWIVVTHEHPDHLGGIARSPGLAALLPRLRLTRPQLANERELRRARFPEPALREIQPLDYGEVHALAPGVALRAAPGHTPGTQLVYVVLADGRELLFVGDVAWHGDNISRLRGRPRGVSSLLLREDRQAVRAQLRALHTLSTLR